MGANESRPSVIEDARNRERERQELARQQRKEQEQRLKIMKATRQLQLLRDIRRNIDENNPKVSLLDDDIAEVMEYLRKLNAPLDTLNVEVDYFEDTMEDAPPL